MPISAYLPDPDKWINTASPSSSSSIKPKQRPLTSFRHGLPTPPTSHPRVRSRSTRTDENAIKPSSTAGPSRLRDGHPAGLSGYFTPPTTSSVPRKQRIGQMWKENEGESSKNRGSPIPRAGAKSKGTPLKVKSRLAEAQEEMDYWNSEDEDAGPSKPRRKSSSKRSPPMMLPPVRKSSALDAFSSGELTDLPPEYMDDDDPVHIPKPLPKKRNLPATTTSTSPAPIAPLIPSSHLAKLPRRDRISPARRSLSPVPTDIDPPSPTQEAAPSPRLLTQPPKAVLAQYWRMNGLSSDRIGQGEEMWGRSAGYVENEERRKAAEKKKREEEALERELEEEVEKAKEAVERVGKIKKHLLLEDTEDEDVMSEPEPSTRSIKRLKKGEEGRVPLSPLRTNTSKRGIRKSPPGSPSPRKKVRRDLDSERPIPFVVREDNQPGSSTTSRGRPSLRSRTSSSRPRNRSRSLSIVDRMDIHLQSVMEEAKRDAEERDVERAKQHFAAAAPTVRRPSTPEQVVHPPKARQNSQSRRHHNVTPPKRRHYTDKEAETLFAFTPPPQPDFTSSPRSSQERREGEEAFRPVEVVETLMTWSLGGGREGELQEGGPVETEQGGNGHEGGRGRRNSRSTDPQPGEEETQSIPASTYSHSFPNLIATQSIPNRPAQPGWPNLSKGILAGPSVSTPTDKQPVSGTTKKRKSLDNPNPPKRGKQSRLEAFGIVKENPERQVKDFEEGFDDEPELEESYMGSDEHVPQAGSSRTPQISKGRLFQVPEAPYHPDLRPAGIRALRARQNTSHTDRSRAERAGVERSSPPLFSPPSSPVRPTPNRDAEDREEPTTPGSVKSPVSSSLLTDSTDDEAPGVSESMKAWWDGLGDR